MANQINLNVSQDDTRDIKPTYQRPVLTELDVRETASGIIPGSPENSTYFTS